VQALARFFSQTPSPVARVHALHALDGQLALNEALILAALKDKHPLVREHAVRVSERLVTRAGRFPEKVWRQLESMARDTDARVRYQLAFTLGEIRHDNRVALLAALLRRDHTNPWARAAALSSLRSGAGEVLAAMWNDTQGAPLSQAREELFRELILIAGTSAKPEEITSVVNVLEGMGDSPSVLYWTTLLAEGLNRGGGSLRTAGGDDRLRRIIESAVIVAVSNTTNEPARLQAIELLGWWEEELTLVALLEIADLPNVLPEIRGACLRSLARYSDDRLPGEFLQRWDRFTPQHKSFLVESLLNRRASRLALLQAMVERRVPTSDTSFLQRRQLLGSADRETSQLAARVFGKPTSLSRAERLEKFRPALELSGNAARGRTLFQERCSDCHGSAANSLVGPLRSELWQGGEATWESVVDPDKSIADGYQGTLVQLRTGEQWEGRVQSETPTAVVIRRAGQPDELLLKGNIHSIAPLDHSLMPAEVLAGLSPQDLADILAALQ
jgi:putative heme-binding domain-containing protein